MHRTHLLERAPDAGSRRDEEIRLLDRAFHSSRNILMSMRGYADLIRRNPDAGHRSEEWAGKIVGQLDRMNDMFRRVESLTRQEETPTETLPVGWLVRSAEAKARERVDVAGIDVDMALDADGWIDGRPRELVEALANLLENALEAAQASIHLNFHQRTTGKWALEILDDGPGLSPTARGRVGQPFFSRKPGHLGLGVFLSQTILQRYGCDLHLENRPEGGARALVTPRIDQRGGIR